MFENRIARREWIIIFMVMTAIIACGIASSIKESVIEARCKKEIEFKRVKVPGKEAKKRDCVLDF